MKSADLAALLAPFKLLANKNQLSATYRALELAHTRNGNVIRGASRFGMLEVHGEFGVPEGAAIYVDASSFIAIIASLPAGEEVEFTLEDGGALAWVCGSAKGRMALMQIKEMPAISHGNGQNAWHPTAEFVEALHLGMLSCGNESLASIGSYGIVIDTREDLCIYSSDNTTISVAFLTDARVEGPEILTFSPESLALLAAVIDPSNDKAKLEFEEQGLYYRDGIRRCIIKQIAPLKVDISAILDKYATQDYVVEMPTDRIQAFIKRIAAMAENKKSTIIKIGASRGKLNMSFQDGVASSEEYYLVDETDVPDMTPVDIDATKLGRALAHNSHIILDHIDRQVIILMGADPIFQYIISGVS
jgi:hypothetical protein